MPPVPIEKMEGPDLLAKHYKEIGITSKRLARKHNEELDATEIKAVLNKKTAKFVYSKKLVAWPIRQKARQDAQKNLGLTVDKLEVTHELTEHHRKLLGRIDGQSRDKLPSEEEDE